MYYVNNIINTIVGFIFLAIICLVIFGLPDSEISSLRSA